MTKSNPPYSYLEIDSKKIAYRDMGSGTPIFCFPGWTVSSNSYLPMAHHLDLSKLRLIMPDVPGWAGKSETSQRKWSVTEYASLFNKFVTTFDLSEFSLLGYSFGGVVVQEMIKQKKLPLIKVFLISTLCEGGASTYDQFAKPIELFTHAKEAGLSDIVIKKRISDIFRKSLEQRHYPTEVLKNPTIKQIVDEYFSGNVISMISSGYSIFNKNFLSENLKSNNTLVLYAERDMKFIIESSGKIAKFLNIEPIVVKGDHNHIFFDPKQTAQEVELFLK